MDSLNIENINQGLRKIINYSGGLESFEEVIKDIKLFESYILDCLPGYEHKKEREVLSFVNKTNGILNLLQAKSTEEQGHALYNLDIALQKYGLKQKQIESLKSVLSDILNLDLNNLSAIQFLDTYNSEKERLLEIVSNVLDNTIYLNMEKETLLLKKIQKNINDDILNIVCIGSNFYGGKYELQDAIIGQNILSFSVNSDYAMDCMQMCVEVKYSKQTKAFIHFKENLSSEISFPISDDVRSHISLFNGKNTPPMEIPYDKLEKYVLPINNDEDSTKLPSWLFTRRSAPYSKLELLLPLNMLKQGMQFINFELDQAEFDKNEFTNNYLSQADVVLFVLSADKLFGGKMDVVENRLSNCDDTPILFAINNFDLIANQEDCDKIIEYAKNKLSKFTHNPIYFVSSRQAIEANQKQDNDLLKKSGVFKFKNELINLLYKKRKDSRQTDKTLWLETLKQLKHIINKANVDLEHNMSVLSEKIENRKNNVPKYKIVKLWDKIVGFMDSMVQSNNERHEKELGRLQTEVDQMISDWECN